MQVRQNNNIAILMPFHKAQMSEYELLSFKNNTRVLASYPIYLLLPANINPKPFLSYAPNIRVIYFDPFYFDTYHGSNQFWLRQELYQKFSEYKYILKCELDAFVFKDTLLRWVNRGYDYVGAPWMDMDVSNFMKGCFESISHSKYLLIKVIKERLTKRNRERVYLVGNGGLSLRKVSSFYRISKLLPLLIPDVFKSDLQEDMIWSLYASSYFPFFKIPDYLEAMQFSLETGLEFFDTNNLPFGCHGWCKENNLQFWKDHIL